MMLYFYLVKLQGVVEHVIVIMVLRVLKFSKAGMTQELRKRVKHLSQPKPTL